MERIVCFIELNVATHVIHIVECVSIFSKKFHTLLVFSRDNIGQNICTIIFVFIKMKIETKQVN